MFGLPQANQLKRLGARIRTDSADSDYPPELAIDGNPETLWHTGWKDAAPEFPHYLIVELPQPVKIAGLTCLPRQDNNPNGGIKGYAVYISGDGKDWGQPVARGSFTKGEGTQTIRFAQPVSSRFIKFVAESAWVSSKPYASLAELDGMVVP